MSIYIVRINSQARQCPMVAKVVYPVMMGVIKYTGAIK